jgi:cytochrome c oxidase cbb3-type subunit III
MFKNSNKSTGTKNIIFSTLLLLLYTTTVAQEAAVVTQPAMSGDDKFGQYVLWTFIGLIFLVFLLFVVTVNNLLKALIETQMATAKATSPEAAARVEAIIKRPSAWKQFMQKMTAAKPIEKEHDILLDHDYDGIKELDNHLPPWWKYGFYLTIIWGVFYVINYHIAPIWNEGRLQLAEYEFKNAEADSLVAEYRKKAVDLVDENNVVLVTDAAALGKGKSKFLEVCAACHGDLGQGGIGPNLTDQFWIHGGDVKSIFTTIKYGVVDKGMISWKDEIKPGEMQALTSYILSLQGTNPAGAKEPQGQLYTPASDSTATDSTALPIVPVNSTAKL